MPRAIVIGGLAVEAAYPAQQSFIFLYLPLLWTSLCAESDTRVTLQTGDEGKAFCRTDRALRSPKWRLLLYVV